MPLLTSQLRCGIAMLVIATGLVAEAGNIRGKIRLVTAVPAPVREGGQLEIVDNRRTNFTNLRDFVVYIESTAIAKYPPPFKPLIVQVRRNTQQEAVFSPHILPVLVGTTVQWRNDDAVYHKFFSLSGSATFEFPLCRPGDVSPSLTLDKPGRVDVFCSLYANLNGIVLVLDNPWFTGTDYRNNYLIQHVPAGTYKLHVWHERLPLQTKEIAVPVEGEVKIDFELNPATLFSNTP